MAGKNDRTAAKLKPVRVRLFRQPSSFCPASIGKPLHTFFGSTQIGYGASVCKDLGGINPVPIFKMAAGMTITSTISEAEYGAIEHALQASEKGRRFLRAYAERNRSFESRRLLRSISRLHRAALGVPGLSAEICRDLVSVLRSVSRHRQSAARCSDVAARSGLLATGLEEVESCLITLIESIEERAFDSLPGSVPGSMADCADEAAVQDRPARLFGELSSYFSVEPR